MIFQRNIFFLNNLNQCFNLKKLLKHLCATALEFMYVSVYSFRCIIERLSYFRISFSVSFVRKRVFRFASTRPSKWKVPRAVDTWRTVKCVRFFFLTPCCHVLFANTRIHPGPSWNRNTDAFFQLRWSRATRLTFSLFCQYLLARKRCLY